MQSYLIGYFPKSRVDKFIQFMSSRSDIHTFVSTISPFKVLFNNHENNDRWFLYFEKVSEDATHAKWHGIPSRLPQNEAYTGVDHFDEPVADMIRKHCVHVLMTGRFFENTSVEPTLLDFIEWEKRQSR